MTMLWASVSAFAYDNDYDFEVDRIYYNITSKIDQTVEVTSYRFDRYKRDVRIPRKVSYSGVTYKVTRIGSSAFEECSDLKSVTIPNSVTSIGESAFSASGLTSVTIPNSVTSIGKSAFSFSGLTSVTIPPSVTNICEKVFYKCRSMTSVTIPNTVTSIGEESFYGCSSLTSVTIPNSVTSIGKSAFSFSGLTSVTIPSSVTNICEKVFYECSSMTSVTIPNTVTSIGEEAFYGCNFLRSVTIPNSIISIGSHAFSHCSSLTSVTIPKSVTSIGEGLFAYCGQLEAIDVQPDNTEFCSNDGILYNKALSELICCPGGKESVIIPTSISTISRCAFQGNSHKSVTIPNTVTVISWYAFKNCDVGAIYIHLIEPLPCDPEFSDYNYKYTILYVPKGSLAAYEDVYPWYNFWNIVEKEFAGVDGVIADSETKTEVGRFNLQGIEVGNDYKGMVIIRYSDGSSCKMYSK